AKSNSRRQLIRAHYFGIYDNLVPVQVKEADYQFFIHGGPPVSNTPERRAFETEKMEFDDITLLPKTQALDQHAILNWIAEKEKVYDYVIIQDIHSFVDMPRLIDTIETHSVQQWGQIERDGLTVIKLSTSKSTIASEARWTSQAWENSIETVDRRHLLIQHVYQDQDFIDLAKAYQLAPFLTTPRHQKPLAVVTSSYIYDQCMEPSGTRASLNKRAYATRHGYAFVARANEFAQQAIRPDARRTVWGKIDVIQKVLPKYEWLFWLDMDAVIMNQDQSIESLMDHLESTYYNGTDFKDAIDFIVVRPGTDKMINAGVFLIKHSAWSLEFLREVQAREEWYRQGPSYEQGAMWDVMREEKYMKRTLFLDRQNHVFNTFPKFYEAGDFVVHFAPDKCPNAATVKGLVAADKIKQGQTISSAELI
ncbi:galactosyl transferase GMA12/MNN10 family-domain-containing protein, partial [Blakeslea trispora]